MKLTDISIKALKAPSKGARIYADDMLSGFGVRVTQVGTKSFVLTHGPRRERETLGRVDIISLQEARQEAKRRLAQYTLGRDKPRSVAWTAAVEEYLGEKSQTHRPRVLRDYKYHLSCPALRRSTFFGRDGWRSTVRIGAAPVPLPHSHRESLISMRTVAREVRNSRTLGVSA